MEKDWRQTGAIEFRRPAEPLLQFTVAQLFEPGDTLFRTGCQRKSRVHRVLSDVDGFLSILDAAQTDDNKALLIKNGHIECAWADISEHQLWRLVNGCAASTQFAPPKNKTRLRLIAVELRLDIHVTSHRFWFQTPPSVRLGISREAATRACVEAWRKLVYDEKKAQFKAYQRDDDLVLPPLPAEWGPVDAVQRMPCALWIQLH